MKAYLSNRSQYSPAKKIIFKNNVFLLMLITMFIIISQSTIPKTSNYRICQVVQKYNQKPVDQKQATIKASQTQIENGQQQSKLEQISQSFSTSIFDRLNGDSIEVFLDVSNQKNEGSGQTARFYGRNSTSPLIHQVFIDSLGTATSIKLANQIVFVGKLPINPIPSVYTFYERADDKWEYNKKQLNMPSCFSRTYYFHSYNTITNTLSIYFTSCGIYTYQLDESQSAVNPVPWGGSFSQVISLSASAGLWGNQQIIYNRLGKNFYYLTADSYEQISVHNFQNNQKISQYPMMSNVIVFLVTLNQNKNGIVYYKSKFNSIFSEYLPQSQIPYVVKTDNLRNFMIFGSTSGSKLVWITALVDGSSRKSILTSTSLDTVSTSDLAEFGSVFTERIVLSGNKAFVLQETKIIYYEHFMSQASSSIQKITEVILSEQIQDGIKKSGSSENEDQNAAQEQFEQTTRTMRIKLECDCSKLNKIERFTCFSSSQNCILEQKIVCRTSLAKFLL